VKYGALNNVVLSVSYGEGEIAILCARYLFNSRLVKDGPSKLAPPWSLKNIGHPAATRHLDVHYVSRAYCYLPAARHSFGDLNSRFAYSYSDSGRVVKPLYSAKIIEIGLCRLKEGDGAFDDQWRSAPQAALC
jgi:hypothetical protein